MTDYDPLMSGDGPSSPDFEFCSHISTVVTVSRSLNSPSSGRRARGVPTSLVLKSLWIAYSIFVVDKEGGLWLFLVQARSRVHVEQRSNESQERGW